MTTSPRSWKPQAASNAALAIAAYPLAPGHGPRPPRTGHLNRGMRSCKRARDRQVLCHFATIRLLIGISQNFEYSSSQPPPKNTLGQAPLGRRALASFITVSIFEAILNSLSNWKWN